MRFSGLARLEKRRSRPKVSWHEQPRSIVGERDVGYRLCALLEESPGYGLHPVGRTFVASPWHFDRSYD